MALPAQTAHTPGLTPTKDPDCLCSPSSPGPQTAPACPGTVSQLAQALQLQAYVLQCMNSSPDKWSPSSVSSCNSPEP